jgi:uncharacterized protein YyaL (SSP411 family)
MSLIIQEILSPYRRIKTGKYLLSAFGAGAEQAALAKNYAQGRLFSEFSDDQHLDAVMKWLCLAQDVCVGDGVPNVYYLNSGWGVAYPETSGYIIATYLAYADFKGDQDYISRAVQLGDWEIKIQAANGGVLSSPTVSYTRVFNTGQVILGWCMLYERTRDANYLTAAKRAGDYLVRLQEHDGSWQKDTYCGARTYHSRVDWALLRLAQLSGNNRFTETAAKNIKWVLDQQRENGWFDNCGFNNENPITHVIEYTLKGLLECHLTNVREISTFDMLPAIRKAADALCSACEKHPVRGIPGMVPTSFDKNWRSTDRHSCLTGNAQIAGFLLQLAQVTGNEYYVKIAVSILSATKRTQLLETSFTPIKGAIAGTYPLYQGYLKNGYPNWAAKFFADALLKKIYHPKTITISA